MRADEKVFTPVGVARLINVHVKSVANWIRQEKLQAYRTPGGHHRITRTSLLRFLNEQQMPIPEALGDSRRQILVVDEDPIVAEVIAAAFEDQPERFEITVIRSGIEALLQIGKRLPDLVVLDIFMPELNCFEVCKQIKDNPERSHLRILSLSGSRDPSVRERILASGADAFLPKPLDREALKRQIEALTHD
ncbi:MAG: response regulator [Acidobacteriota bacterium]